MITIEKAPDLLFHSGPIPVFRPSLRWSDVERELRPVIESGWLGEGPKVAELEKLLADRLGAAHCVATSSCTAALQLAVHCLDLPKGSRVLTSPITFVSTNAALVWEGLEPVFGNVDERNGMTVYNPFAVGADGIVGEAKAVIAVHLGGAECPMSKLKFVPVIEDCAHAFGAPWLTEQGHHMRCWSFHAVKNLPMGDGGAISTNDAALAERLRRLRWLGISKSTHTRSQGCYAGDYTIQELGWKFHMNDVTAALGMAALKRVDHDNMRRRQIAYQYWEAFPEARPTYMPHESACHFYPLFFDHRHVIEQRLQAANISSTRHYKPNFLYAPFEQYPKPGWVSAMQYYDKVLILPIYPDMTDWDVMRVIAAVRG